FARRFVGAGHKNAIHVEPDRNDHSVRAPTVDLTHDAERHLFAKIADVDVCVFECGPVIEHEQQTSECQYEKKKKSNPAHAPRVAHANARFADFDRMQVEKNAAEHDQHAFAVRIRDADTEDGSINLTILDVFANSCRRQRLESFFKPISEISHMLR